MLSACDKQEEVAAPELPRPVKTHVIGSDEAGGMRRLPARVYASKRAEISFRVQGLIVELPAKEGDFVKKGQLLAQLAGGMASPLSSMASLFAAPLRNLGYGLQQLKEQREGTETA